MKRNIYNKGFTFIEVVIAVVVFTIFAFGAYQGYTAVYTAVAAAHHKALAADLVNTQFEILKNLPYASVGTVGGNPSGVINASQTLVSDNISFIVTTTINNVDDPFDGVSPSDPFPRDYKLVEIEVACQTCRGFNPIVITGRIAPANLES